MAKLTKPIYKKRLAALQAQLDALKAQENILSAEFDALAKPISPATYEEFHKRFHANESLIWDKEREIEALHSEWMTRNWTASDWNRHELIANNCD